MTSIKLKQMFNSNSNSPSKNKTPATQTTPITMVVVGCAQGGGSDLDIKKISDMSSFNFDSYKDHEIVGVKQWLKRTKIFSFNKAVRNTR